MNEDDDNKHLHINIYKDNKEKIDNSANKSECYLIAANEELNNKIRCNIEELLTVKNENDTLMEESERLEKCVTYQRGLLHNFNSINKTECELNELYKLNTVTFNEHIKSTINLESQIFIGIEKLMYLMPSLMILSIALNITDIYNISIFFIIFCSSIFITTFYNKLEYNFKKTFNSNHTSYYEKIKDNNIMILNKVKDIEKIKKSNDFISDYIDVV
jgi:hypothetical protein